MFTGLIESVGTVRSVRRGTASAVLEIEDGTVTEGLAVGDSVAVNGICLTAVTVGGGRFSADVMHETLNRSSLGALRAGSRVNLERAMRADGRFGGHMVAGHVDGTGIIRDIRRDDNAVWYTIGAPPGILRYIVEKGSVAVDGISLTVAALGADSFSVSVIPHTAAQTTLAERKKGDRVNLENDLVGKYVERLLGLAGDAGRPQDIAREQGGRPGDGSREQAGSGRDGRSGGITEAFLRANGF